MYELNLNWWEACGEVTGQTWDVAEELRTMALKKTFEFPSGYFGDTFNWCCKIKKSWGQNKFFSKKNQQKTATVTPIYKSGDEHLFSNYKENLLLFKLPNDENIFF